MDNPYTKKFRKPRKKFTPAEIKTALDVAMQALQTEQEMVWTWKPKIGKKLSSVDSFILNSDRELLEPTAAHAVMRSMAQIKLIEEKISYLNSLKQKL